MPSAAAVVAAFVEDAAAAVVPAVVLAAAAAPFGLAWVGLAVVASAHAEHAGVVEHAGDAAGCAVASWAFAVARCALQRQQGPGQY